MRESLMREARSILNSQRRCSPSWTTIVDTVGKKLSDLIREVVKAMLSQTCAPCEFKRLVSFRNKEETGKFCTQTIARERRTK